MTTDVIREIAEQLDCGFCAFIHKTTKQVLFVPDEKNFPEINLESWDKEFLLLEKNFSDYHEIEKWTSQESFEMMYNFAEQVSDIKLQNELLFSLRKNKPFREFKLLIDRAIYFRQQWFDFKNKWQQDFVTNQLYKLQQKDDSGNSGN